MNHFDRDPLQRVAALPINALSVDVEDYFQVQALSASYPREDWTSCQSRVQRNTEVLLALFAETQTKATFFTLGWIAERHPALVRAIVDQGHELASHGYAHHRVDRQSPEEFRADIRKTKAILEGCAGSPVNGYRAATFSMSPATPWAFPILEEEGYLYSSSVYPVAHDNYSYPNAPRFPFKPNATSNFWEFPISTVRIAGRNVPCGGGGYFRLAPYSLFRLALKRITRQEGKPAIFYLHPWEVDPEQPRPAGVPLKSRFRHYLNLARTIPRLRRLLADFSWDRVDRVLASRGIDITAPRAEREFAKP
jgi:polysaccharide deacetylase family protein (PEP-CTERM system associated)